MRILIVGSDAYTGVGGSLLRAAQKEGRDASLIDTAMAYQANPLVQRVYWHLLGRRPYRLREFSAQVLEQACDSRAHAVIATGIAPLDAAALGSLRAAGVRTANFLTDDPWNHAHTSRWFLHALPLYDVVFTPRRSNVEELIRAGCRTVHYMPFGYDEDVFFAESVTDDATGELASDVYFAGGADVDRVPYLGALIEAGLDVRLHGGYWSRYSTTRAYDKGIATPAAVRRGLNSTKVALCLVRRANRDGNCMRTFEAPASGACLLAEDTPEHRDIFGADGQAAFFFGSVEEMVEKARMLVNDAPCRKRVAEAGHALITRGGHTYRDRLLEMLRVLEPR